MFGTAVELLNNIRLLGFNSSVHSKGQLSGDLDPNLFMNNGDNSKLFQVITFFLFRCLDKRRAERDFEGCFPATSRSQASTFLNKTCTWLEDLKKSSPLLRHVPIRRSYLIDCRGVEINRIMVAFSTVVLEKVLARDKISTDVIYSNTSDIEQAIQTIHDEFQQLQVDKDAFMQNASIQAREYSEILNDTSSSSTMSPNPITRSQQSPFLSTTQLRSSLRKPLVDVKNRLTALHNHKRKHHDDKDEVPYETYQQRRTSSNQSSSESYVKSFSSPPPLTYDHSYLKRRRFELKEVLSTKNSVEYENISSTRKEELRTKTSTLADRKRHILSQYSPKTPPLNSAKPFLSDNDLTHDTNISVEPTTATSAYLRSSPISTSSARSRLEEQMAHNSISPIRKSPSSTSVTSKASSRSLAHSPYKQQGSINHRVNDDGGLYSQPYQKHTPSPNHRYQSTTTKSPLFSASPASAHSLRTPDVASFRSSPFSPNGASSAKTLTPTTEEASRFHTNLATTKASANADKVATIEADFPNFRQELATILNKPTSSSAKRYVIMPKLEELTKIASSFNGFDDNKYNPARHISWTPPPNNRERKSFKPRRRSSSSTHRLSAISQYPMANREDNTADSDLGHIILPPERRRSSFTDRNSSIQHRSIANENFETTITDTETNDNLNAATPLRRYSMVTDQPAHDNSSTVGTSRDTSNNASASTRYKVTDSFPRNRQIDISPIRDKWSATFDYSTTRIETYVDENDGENERQYPLTHKFDSTNAQSPNRQHQSSSAAIEVSHDNDNSDTLLMSPMRNKNVDSPSRSPLTNTPLRAAVSPKSVYSPFASPYANRSKQPGMASPQYGNRDAFASASPIGSVFMDDVETVAGIEGEEPPWRPLAEDRDEMSQGQQRYPQLQNRHLYDIDLYTPSRPLSYRQ